MSIQLDNLRFFPVQLKNEKRVEDNFWTLYTSWVQEKIHGLPPKYLAQKDGRIYFMETGDWVWLTVRRFFGDKHAWDVFKDVPKLVGEIIAAVDEGKRQTPGRYDFMFQGSNQPHSFSETTSMLKNRKAKVEKFGFRTLLNRLA